MASWWMEIMAVSQYQHWNVQMNSVSAHFKHHLLVQYFTHVPVHTVKVAYIVNWFVPEQVMNW